MGAILETRDENATMVASTKSASDLAIRKMAPPPQHSSRERNPAVNCWLVSDSNVLPPIAVKRRDTDLCDNVAQTGAQ